MPLALHIVWVARCRVNAIILPAYPTLMRNRRLISSAALSVAYIVARGVQPFIPILLLSLYNPAFIGVVYGVFSARFLVIVTTKAVVIVGF